jgi:hypothetical protein
MRIGDVVRSQFSDEEGRKVTGNLLRFIAEAAESRERGDASDDRRAAGA